MKKSWDKNYNELNLWVNENNRFPSGSSQNNIEKQLGIWANTQRLNKRTNKLSQNKIDKLNNIQGWFWNLNIEVWDQNFEKLKIWVSKNNKIPSGSSKNDEEKQLGKWCGDQRFNKKKNKLKQNKIEKLNNIIGWYWGDNVIRKLIPWEEHYNDLKSWVDKNNKLPLSSSQNNIEKQLASWCIEQRKRKNKLDEDKINKLNNIEGWYWNREDLWDSKYNELKLWIIENEKIPSGSSENIIEKRLGQWCGDQRKNKKKNILSQERINKLNEIKYWYWIGK